MHENIKRYIFQDNEKIQTFFMINIYGLRLITPAFIAFIIR